MPYVSLARRLLGQEIAPRGGAPTRFRGEFGILYRSAATPTRSAWFLRVFHPITLAVWFRVIPLEQKHLPFARRQQTMKFPFLDDSPIRYTAESRLSAITLNRSGDVSSAYSPFSLPCAHLVQVSHNHALTRFPFPLSQMERIPPIAAVP